MMTEAPGRRYDPTLNDGRGGWPDPPRPWLDDPRVVKARKVADEAEAVYQTAYGRWLELVSEVQSLQLRGSSGPTLMPADGSTIYTPANRAAAQAKALEESDQLAAFEARERAHRQWIDARTAYEAEVARARRRHEG